jgi:release factor glutamine methyltransferase
LSCGAFASRSLAPDIDAARQLAAAGVPALVFSEPADLPHVELRLARGHGRAGQHVDFAAGSLLDPLPASWRGGVSLVCANVPCVPRGAYEVSLDAPARAYVGGGRDGLGLQWRLAEQARDGLSPGGWLLVQLAPSQWAPYRETLDRLGFEALEARGDGVAVVGAGRRPGGRCANVGYARPMRGSQSRCT